MDDSVIADGALYLATDYDPLFMLLPALEKHRQRARHWPPAYLLRISALAEPFYSPAQTADSKGRFCSLDQILESERLPGGPFVSAVQQLIPLVCDVKSVGSERFVPLPPTLVRWPRPDGVRLLAGTTA